MSPSGMVFLPTLLAVIAGFLMMAGALLPRGGFTIMGAVVLIVALLLCCMLADSGVIAAGRTP